jgi:hypothetical protein
MYLIDSISNMKIHFLILLLFTSLPSFPQALQKDGIYQSGDSTIEIKTWEEQNIIREFIRFEGKEEFYYKEFDFKTKHLKAEGLLKNGFCSGTWKFYKKNGSPDHELTFETTPVKPYITAAGPYEDTFNDIKQKCDSLLAKKIAKNSNFIFHFHSSQSYYYRAGSRKGWKALKDIRPTAFLMRYDLVFNDGQLYRTFPYLELELDSAGTIKKMDFRSRMTGYKNIDFIAMKTAASIALKNGLSTAEAPFEFEFRFVNDSLKRGKLILRVAGRPFDIKEEKDQGWILTTFQFQYVDMEPWTGRVIESGITSGEERKLP